MEEQNKQISFMSAAAKEQYVFKSTVDTKLILKAMDGDKDAFSTVFMGTYKRVYYTVRGYLKNDEDICDAIQDTYLKAYIGIKRLRSPEAFTAWLNQIAANSAKDILSSRQEIVIDSDYLGDPQPTNNDVTLDISHVLSKLSYNEAQLLTLVYYDGMRIAEIARMQNKPLTTVYSQFSAAKKNLKKQLKIHGIDKPVYSHDILSLVSTTVRDAIGTELLSLAVAQEILSAVVNHKVPITVVLEKILRKKRNKAILKLASIIALIAAGVSVITVLCLSPALFPKGTEPTINATTSLYQSSDLVYSSELSDVSQNSFPSKQETVWDKIVGIFTPDKNDAEQTSEPFLSSDVVNSTEQHTSIGSPSYSDVQTATSVQNSTSSQNSTSNQTSSKEDAGSSSVPGTSEQEFIQALVDKYGEAGNLAHNTTQSGGSVAIKDGWIYYGTNSSIYTNYIYKIKPDGSQKQQIAARSYSVPQINVVGDWVYYAGASEYSTNGCLCKVRTDGTGFKRLTDYTIHNLQVFGTTGFFTAVATDEFSNSFWCYYKVDFTTDQITCLAKDIKTENICIAGQYVILSNFYSSPDRNYVVEIYNLNGQLVKKFMGWCCIYKNNIIIFENGVCQLYDFSDLENVKKTFDFQINGLKGFSSYNGGCIIASGGAYFINQDTKVDWAFEWNKDTDRRRLATFEDGYVYYVSENNLYRQYPDGTGLQKMNTD